mgnify:CR=1 FL=1
MVTTAKPDRIAATTLDQATLNRWISQLLTGRARSGLKGRFTPLHDAIKNRDEAFYAMNPPKFNPPFDKMQTFQSDALRQTHQEAKARLTEHPFVVHVKPTQDAQEQRDAADQLEVVLGTGLDLAQERTRISIQSFLADGQLLHCYGVLHWYKLADLWGPYPEPEELDELPDDDDPKERDRKRKQYRPYSSVETPKREGAKYRETEEAVKERDKHARAKAGFPFGFDVLRPDTFAFVPDRSALNGMGLAVTIRNVPMLDYRDALGKEGISLSVWEANRKIRIGVERDRPERWEDAADDRAWGRELRVCQVWTRDECYELTSLSEGGDFELVKSWAHPYEMPPFALAKAIEINHPDPLRSFQPWLMGLYRVKPDYDYERSLGRALAEQSALPKYWVQLESGTFWTDAHGQRVVLSGDALTAEALPAGAKLMHADLTVDPAFVAFLQMSKDDIAAARPETGHVDVSATTQPHTLSMSQAQANTEIAMLKGEVVAAARIALRNIAMVMSKPVEQGGFGNETVWVYAKFDSRTGKVKNGTVVGVDPSKIPSLDIQVSVNPNSGAQEIAKAEWLRTQLNDPRTAYTTRQYLEDTGEENADARIESWMAEQAEMKALSKVVDQELARRYGDVMVLMPGGSVAGADGQLVTPEQVLERNGWSRQQPPGPPPPTGSPPGVSSPAGLGPLGGMGPLGDPAQTMAGVV